MARKRKTTVPGRTPNKSAVQDMNKTTETKPVDVPAVNEVTAATDVPFMNTTTAATVNSDSVPVPSVAPLPLNAESEKPPEITDSYVVLNTNVVGDTGMIELTYGKNLRANGVLLRTVLMQGDTIIGYNITHVPNTGIKDGELHRSLI